MVEKYKGILKHRVEKLARRLLVKMLQLKILKEVFVTLDTGFGKSISAYLAVGRNAQQLWDGDLKVTMSDGTRENANQYMPDSSNDKVLLPVPSYLKQST